MRQRRVPILSRPPVLSHVPVLSRVRVLPLVVAVVLFLLSVLGGCAPEREIAGLAPDADGETGAARLRSVGYLAGSPAAPPAEAAASPQASALGALWAQRKLIRTATVTLEVADVPRALEHVRRAAEAVEGFVGGSEVTRDDHGGRHATLTVRVPATRFDEAMSAMAKLGEVRAQRVQTEDVTKAYTDLETRLGVKRQTEQRLRALLLERTGSLADVLGVERELDRVVTEIEQMEGERRYYDQQVAVSVITLILDEPGTGGNPGLVTAVREALRDSVRTFTASVAGLVYVVAFVTPWLVLATLAWWVVRRLAGRRAARGGAGGTT